MTDYQPHAIQVPRTARYYNLRTGIEPVEEVWFVLHGYGQLAGFFIRNFQELNVSVSRLIVAPEGLSRFYLGENQWQRVGASWMTREDREDEIVDQIRYLNTLYQKMQLEYKLSETVRLVVFGFSQGAAIAWRWVERARLTPSDLVLWAGSVPDEMAHISSMRTTRLWTLCGTNDQFVSVSKVQEILEIVQRTGLKHVHIEFEGEHTIPSTVLNKLADEMQLTSEE